MRQMILKKIDKENTFQPNFGPTRTHNDKRSSIKVYDRLYDEFTRRQESR